MFALQKEPSEPLLLLALDELASAARHIGHVEAETFEELYRQAGRHQGDVNMASLCLSVLNGQASDVVGKALAKCQKKETAVKAETPKNPSSPLANLYPPALQQWPGFGPQGFGSMGQLVMGGYMPAYPSQYKPRFYKARAGQNRPRGACHFCNSTEHQVKDCMLMRKAQEKK